MKSLNNMKVKCPKCNNIFYIDEETKKNKPKTILKDNISLPKKNKQKLILTGGAKQQKKVIIKTVESKLLAGDKLKNKILRQSTALPPMSHIVQQAFAVLDNSNTSFKDVGNVLEKDQAMAARILKTANSAYYGLSMPVSSVQQASALLGLQTIIEIVTVASTSKFMEKTLKGYNLSSRYVWHHSLSVAFGAKTIALAKNKLLQNDAFSAGLIHDLGKIILDKYVYKKKEDFEIITKDLQEPVHFAEKRIFGFDHAEIAADFIKSWKLPKAQINAIKYHHYPSCSDNDVLSYIIHAANSIALMDFSLSVNDNIKMFMEKGTMEFLKLNEEHIVIIADKVKEFVSKITAK